MGILLGYCKQATVASLVALSLTLLPLNDVQAKLEQPTTHTAIPKDHAHAFPTPPSLEPAVDFWTKVFGVWRRDQLALHDNEYLGVIYQLAEFPGPVAEGLTTAQRVWMREQEANLVSQLRNLSYKKTAGRTLNSQEQALYDAIHRGGGTLKGAADRVRSQRGTRERFLRGLEISGRYDRIFREVFRAQGLPEDLAYMPHVESSFQIGARSSVGAAGMWQFMPKTALSYMTVGTSVDERLNPITAAQAAARYLADAYRTLGNWPMAVTSYNHGVGSMRRAKMQYGNDFARVVREYDAPSFGFASRNFYVELLAVRRIAQAPEDYFPEGVRYQTPLAVKPLVLKRATHAHEISHQSGAKLAALTDLNPGWSDRALTGKTRIPAGVTVWLPTGKHNVDFSQFAESAISSKPAGSKSSSNKQHRVTKGDSLWSIARRYDTTVAALSSYNGIDAKKPNLPIGKKLDIPPAGASTSKKSGSADITTHRVGPGDTPFGIASIYQISLRDLLTANNMNNRSVIRPGQKLVIPSKP